MARIILIDSGVNRDHPHVAEHAGVLTSATVDAEGKLFDDPGQQDAIGHGTAAAAAILDRAPRTELHSLKVFHERPDCPFEHVLLALEHALGRQPDLVNLSLGTPHAEWHEPLQQLLDRAAELEIRIVAPASFSGLPCYPGALPGAVGVLDDPNLPRERPEERPHGERSYWHACPFPRPLPGLPREANISGISMAAANVTGYLAASLQ